MVLQEAEDQLQRPLVIDHGSVRLMNQDMISLVASWKPGLPAHSSEVRKLPAAQKYGHSAIPMAISRGPRARMSAAALEASRQTQQPDLCGNADQHSLHALHSRST